MSTKAPSNSDQPPPMATNVATAYPTTSSKSGVLPRLLSLATLFGALCVLIVHRVDHPVTRWIRKSFHDNFPLFPGSNHKVLYSKPLTSTPSLAVCFSGSVSTLNKVAQQNIQAVLDVDKHAAIFYNLDLKDDYYHDRTGTHFDITHQQSALHFLYQYENVVRVATYSASAVRLPVQSKCYRDDHFVKRRYASKYTQFYAAAACYQMIQQVEKEAAHKFEWILQTQPNMNIMVKLPPASAHPRVHMSGAAMALMPRQLADDYYSVVRAFSDGRCDPLDDVSADPCKNYSYDAHSTPCLIIKWLGKSDITPSNGVYLNRRVIYPAEEG